MKICIIDDSIIYSIGLKTYLDEIGASKHNQVTISCSKTFEKLLLNNSFDLLFCDVNLFNVADSNNAIINLKTIFPDLILICTCQGLQNFDLKTMVNSNCSGIIDKSMSKSEIEKFLSKLSFNTQNPDFSILFKSFAKEQKIKTRLHKKYKYQNVILREDLLKFELGQDNTNNSTDGISSINLAI